MNVEARDRFLHEALIDGELIFWFYETSQQQLLPKEQRSWIDWQVEFMESRRP